MAQVAVDIVLAITSLLMLGIMVLCALTAGYIQKDWAAAPTPSNASSTTPAAADPKTKAHRFATIAAITSGITAGVMIVIIVIQFA